MNRSVAGRVKAIHSVADGERERGMGERMEGGQWDSQGGRREESLLKPR